MTSGDDHVGADDVSQPSFEREGATERYTSEDASAYEEPPRPNRPPRDPMMTPSGQAVAPDPEVGDVLAGYELHALLGRGGAGAVFKALRQSDGSMVALKVLSASKVKRARVVQRFFDEVRAARQVRHDGLIEILDFIEEEEPRRLAYAMEYVEGEMLRTRLQREASLDLRIAIQIGVQICDALSALHRGGIVHRDLKPENILLTGPADAPRVKLLDFGVVKFLPVDPTQGAPESKEKPGTFVGTPRYMAPEQAAGTTIDARADLFSLGVLLFEMITGRCPHEGDSLRDVVLAKLKGAPRITVNPEKEILPQELTEVVDACLRLKPGLRPKDARRVGGALSDAVVVLFAAGPVRAAEPETSSQTDLASLEATAEDVYPPTVESTPVVESRSDKPEDTDRKIILGLVAVVVVAALILAVLLVRRYQTPDEAVLVVPETSTEGASGLAPSRTATTP